MRRTYVPIPDDGSTDAASGSVNRGGADFGLVGWHFGCTPFCALHGAMNKVSPGPDGLWRCVHAWPCRAGAMELST